MTDNTHAAAAHARVQRAEGHSRTPGGRWHPHVRDQWHEAGYAAAMADLLELAADIATRPDSTARDTIGAVITAALAALQLRQDDDLVAVLEGAGSG